VALLFAIKFTSTNCLMPDVQNINLSKIIKRLELIKSLISFEEEDEIDAHIFKLEQFGSKPSTNPSPRSDQATGFFQF